MNHLENSLCASCEHLTYCSLTSDKGFIWSCSEYEVTEEHDPAFQEKIIQETNHLAISEGEILFV